MLLDQLYFPLVFHPLDVFHHSFVYLGKSLLLIHLILFTVCRSHVVDFGGDFIVVGSRFKHAGVFFLVVTETGFKP